MFNGFSAQLAGAVEYTDWISAEGWDYPKECPNMTFKIWEWGFSDAGSLGTAEYPFIAIVPKSTLARSCSTW